MRRLGLNIQKVKAVFISHEHTDHISGLQVLAKKFKLQVYITHATNRYSRLRLEKNLISIFTAHKPIVVGDLSISAFPKFHDAADPYSFIVSCNHVKVGVFTDIGTPCENLIHHFKQCHAAFLESNYDDEMLEKGNYPYHLKKRISGNNGHLSNKQALELFCKHRPSFMSHLFLSHLSKNNNCPELVKNLFNQNANGVKIIVASRYEETEVYQIAADKKISFVLPQKKSTPQLSFSFS